MTTAAETHQEVNVISEEEKVIICSLLAAADACEAAGAGYRVLAAADGPWEDRSIFLHKASACERKADKLREEAEELRDGRDMPQRSPGASAEED